MLVKENEKEEANKRGKVEERAVIEPKRIEIEEGSTVSHAYMIHGYIVSNACTCMSVKI